jgi:cardiolipin synthase
MDSYWWTALTIGEGTWVVLLSLYILLERRSPHATLAWILILSFLPGVGAVLYLLLGPRRYERRKRRRAVALESVRSRARTDARAAHNKADHLEHLMEQSERAVGIPARPRRATVELLETGKAKYLALEAAIERAKHHIHLEYYIWEPDTVGTRIRDLLAKKAAAGVEVRVLVDGFGASKASGAFWRPLRDAGGQVERFNELSLFRWQPRMANFRTHRKIAVIDGLVGLTGGMNISDVHTEEQSKDRAWRDTHLLIHGRGVKGLQLLFLEDWHYATGDAPSGPPYIAEEGDDHRPHVMQVVASGPDENLDAIHKLFFSSFAGAHERVWLTTPYFVPDATIVDALSTASLRGADVRVLVPGSGDIPLVAAAARSYYPELLDVGVRIFEYRDPVLHAKTIVIDDDLSIVGTANTDNRSFRLNFEVAVAIYDTDITARLAESFTHDLTRANEITLETVAGTPFFRRLSSSVARIFSPML